MALDRLLQVYSTARYRHSQATEGEGTSGVTVLEVAVHSVHKLRYALDQNRTHLLRERRQGVGPHCFVAVEVRKKSEAWYVRSTA